MSDDQFRAPAGWYPDPLGLPQLRWWNNHGWTEQVSAAPEPVLVQEARLPFKEAEPARVAVQEAPAAFRAPAPPQSAAASTLNELEGPRAPARVAEPTAPAPVQAAAPAPAPVQVAAPAQAAAAAPAPVATSDFDDWQANFVPSASIAAPTPAPAPPAYWDADDDSLPTPSIRPEDLKFWPGTSPAELRRQAREQATHE